MNEQVEDTSKTLKELAIKPDLMRQTVDSLHAEIYQLNRKIEAQSKAIRTLKKENASLRNRVSKYVQPLKDSLKKSILCQTAILP